MSSYLWMSLGKMLPMGKERMRCKLSTEREIRYINAVHLLYVTSLFILFKYIVLRSHANTKLLIHNEPRDQERMTKPTHRPQSLRSVPCATNCMQGNSQCSARCLTEEPTKLSLLPSLSASLPLCQSLATHDRCDPERGETQTLRCGKYNRIRHQEATEQQRRFTV